jgi:hypothetical protein
MAAIALIALTAGQAQAAVEYFYVADATNYSGVSGSTVKVDLFLREVVLSGQTIIGPSGLQMGLFSVVIGVNRAGGDSAISSATGNTTQFPNLPAVDVVNAGANAGFVLNAPLGGAVVATPKGGGVNEIFIGSMNVTVGTGSTTFKIVNGNFADPGTGAGTSGAATLTFAGGHDLDAAAGTVGPQSYQGTGAFPDFQFTVTELEAIPEPSSIALCGVLAAGFAARVYRRRKTTESAPTVA